MNLFYNGQLAMCIGNLTNLWDARNKGWTYSPPTSRTSPARATAASSNGFCVFDNGDQAKIQAAKDFIRFLYTDEEVMKYTLGTLPVNQSIVERYGDEIWMLRAYGENTPNTVDNIRSGLNWQGVRDVFYPNIRDLLMGTKTPEQVAGAIDERCNAALEQGRADFD